MSTLRGSHIVFGTVALGALLLLPATATAHFILDSPPASAEQSALGDPQKAPPCGDDGSAVATNIVTTYQPGETFTLTIDERIFHPGHYRIAIAVDDINQLPEPPPVTPGATPCGSAPIDANPAFPVLADGVFEHTQPFNEPQTIQITLPDDLSCTACTLQVIQFMSDHALNVPGGCYYHHCATIAVEGDPVGATSSATEDSGATDNGNDATTATPSDDTTAGNADASADTNPGNPGSGTVAISATDPGIVPGEGSDSGCGCSQSQGTTGALGMMLGLLGLMGLRLRRETSPNRA